MLLLILLAISTSSFSITRINLEFKNYNAINYKKKIYRKFNLISYTNQSSAALIEINKKVMRARIKTNGELPKHWNFNSKSYNVILKDSLYKRMNSFNVIKASDKGFFVEAFALEIAKSFGLTVPYFEFIKLCISNECGLYILKEDTTQMFLESRFLRGSSIFKPHYGFRKSANKHPTLYSNSYLNSFSKPNPALYNPLFYKTVGSDKNDLIFFNFLKNGVKLDQRKYQIWFYIQKLFGSFHASEMDNKAWLFNIKTMKFEPILKDVLLSPFRYSISESIEYLKSYDKQLTNVGIPSRELSKQLLKQMKSLNPSAWKSQFKGHLSHNELIYIDTLILIWNSNLAQIVAAPHLLR